MACYESVEAAAKRPKAPQPSTSDGALGQLQTVVAHDLADLRRVETFQIVNEIRGFGETLGVRPVRTEQHVVGTDLAAQVQQIVFVVGRHPNLTTKHFDRVLNEHVLLLPVGEPGLVTP